MANLVIHALDFPCITLLYTLLLSIDIEYLDPNKDLRSYFGFVSKQGQQDPIFRPSAPHACTQPARASMDAQSSFALTGGCR